MIFLLAAAALAAAVLAAAAASESESGRHAALYAEYTRAEALIEENRYAEALPILERLQAVYRDAYVLELRQLDCEIGLDNADALLPHAQRALELYPLLARNAGFMNMLAFCYERIGDEASAESIRQYMESQV
jgi:tetratricopeptide (TPR) repeat protein